MIGLQRPDRAHVGPAGGRLLRSAPVRARAAADLVPQLGVRRPLQRRCAAPAHSRRSSWAIRRYCWCATMRACCRGFTTPAGIAARRCAASPRGCCAAGSIICPYHAWVYNLQGDLLRTSSKSHASGFDVADFPLYPIRVREWNGFIFVALTEDPPAFEKMFDRAVEPARCLAARGTRRRPRPAQDHREQLEDILGELQRVPALPGRAPAVVAAGAHLWPRAAGGAGRSAVERARRGLGSEVQGRNAQRRGDLVDWTAGSPAFRSPACPRRIARPAMST